MKSWATRGSLHRTSDVSVGTDGAVECFPFFFGQVDKNDSVGIAGLRASQAFGLLPPLDRGLRRYQAQARNTNREETH